MDGMEGLWGKGAKGLGKWLFYVFFWLVWKERNRIAFGNEELSLQRLKYSFVSNLWSWVRVSLVESPYSLVSFLDWIGS